MTEYLSVNGGTIAYEVSGSGPLIVLAHGVGDSRAAYDSVIPQLVAAGNRVAAVDLRGFGQSSVDWDDWSRSAIAGDLLALIDHLGGPAVLVGHSLSGGAATIAAAREPALISAVVELAPFTRKQSVRLSDLRVTRFRRAAGPLMGVQMFGRLKSWRKYLDLAYPGDKPANWPERLERIDSMLREPGRMKAMQRMFKSPPTDAGEQLGKVRSPVVVVMGSLDPDWADPRAEGEAIINALPTSRGRLVMIDGAGHYPHDQFPDQVASIILKAARPNGVHA